MFLPANTSMFLPLQTTDTHSFHTSESPNLGAPGIQNDNGDGVWVC